MVCPPICNVFVQLHYIGNWTGIYVPRHIDP